MARILVVEDEGLLRGHISKLLAGANHEVEEAVNGQDGLTKLRGFSPDLILVDFVMPKMNGFQFCAALRTIAKHRETPVVLLSGRSDRIRESFIERFGVRDAISKPFQDEALLAVVQNVLGDKEQKRWSIPPPLSSLLGALSTGEQDELANPIIVASERIAGFVIDEIEELKERRDDIIRAISAGMKKGDPSGCAELLSDLENASDSLSLSGNGTSFPLPDVMQLISLQRQSGILEAITSGSSVAIQFRQGYVEMAMGKGVRPEFLLGRYLVEEDIIAQQDLDLMLKNRTGPRLLGDQLVKLGYVSEADLARVLSRQTSDIIYEVLRWKHSRFRFRPDQEIPGAAQAGNRLDVANLVMEGLRRIDEWRLIEREIPNFDTVIETVSGRGSIFDPKDLSDDETLVMDCLLDGPKTVRDVVSIIKMGSFNVCKILYRLITVKLIHRIEK